ncbi:MAG: methyltransferase domain-containing protein, partial [Acidimicrobiales bacterium]
MSTTEIIADGPHPAHAGRQHGTYVVPNGWDDARRRLAALEQCLDPATTRRLEATGVGPGWRCLEVGAGAGSITRWLCQRVGPTGQVVAVDMDTRFLEELDDQNLEVRRQDVVDEPLPSGGFDLVHTRALLMHLPAREAVLADLVAAVRPGGWLVVEEGDFFSIFAAASGVYRAVFESMARTFAPAGLASDWARHLPALFASAGLHDIVADADVQFFTGGASAAAQLMALSLTQVREAMLAGGCPEEDLDHCLALLE